MKSNGFPARVRAAFAVLALVAGRVCGEPADRAPSIEFRGYVTLGCDTQFVVSWREADGTQAAAWLRLGQRVGSLELRGFDQRVESLAVELSGRMHTVTLRPARVVSASAHARPDATSAKPTDDFVNHPDSFDASVRAPSAAEQALVPPAVHERLEREGALAKSEADAAPYRRRRDHEP